MNTRGIAMFAAALARVTRKWPAAAALMADEVAKLAQAEHDDSKRSAAEMRAENRQWDRQVAAEEKAKKSKRRRR